MDVREKPTHKARRDTVRSIEKNVSRLKHMQNTPNDLKRLRIRELPLELDIDGHPAFHGSFFGPLESTVLDPDDEPLGDEFSLFDEPDEGPKYDDMRPIDWANDISRYILSYVKASVSRTRKLGIQHWPMQPGGNGIEFYDFEGYDRFWYATAVFKSVPEQPHYKCMMTSNIDIGGDDRLTRFELLCICRIMAKRLNSRRYIEHMIAPVLIISCMGPRQARILHAHYDGSNLVVRKSKLYDLRSQDNETLRLLIRWWCSYSVGDTISA